MTVYARAMPNTILRGLLVILLIFAAEASQLSFAQSPLDPFLKRLEGVWQGEGKSLNMRARLELHWEWVLGNKFLRLSLKNQMTTSNGQTQLFEGRAYYRALGNEKFEATWFDSRGLTFPIKAAADANALVAFWGSPETEQGKSTYRLLEPGQLEVVDEVRQKDGTYKEFARFSLRRE